MSLFLITLISTLFFKLISISRPPLKSIPKFKPFQIRKKSEIIKKTADVMKKKFLLLRKLMFGVFFIILINMLKF